MERKLFRYFKFSFFLLAITLITTSCTREVKNSAKISIKFPVAASSLNISHSVSALSTKWQLGDPSASNQINCFAIAIETQSGGNTCYTTGGNILARPTVIHGGFASGTEQSIEVSSGPDRKIILIGFQTSNATYCKDVNSSPNGLDPAYFSAPVILDSVKMDLPANQTVAVNLTVPATLPATGKFEECTPYTFGRSGSGSTAPLTVASITPTSGSISGSQTVTLTGTGFDASTTVTLGGDPCTSAVVTPTTLTCSTPAQPAGATDVVVTRGPATITLSGAYTYFVTPALLSINLADPYVYGTLPNGGNTTQTFTLSNSGDTAATAITGAGLAAPYAFYGGSFPGTGGTCGATLAPQSSCTFLVNFAPTSTGAHSDAIEIGYHDGTAPQTQTRTVQGAGAPPAVLTISNTGFDFGVVASGSVNEVSLTITNTGAIPAASLTGSGLATPYAFKGGSYPGTGGTCATTLAPAATCTIIVVFTPPGTSLYSDTIDIGYNDGVSAQTASNTIQGTGAPVASITVSNGPTYDFGNQPIGTTTPQTFTVTNVGGVTATAMSYGGLTAPYSITGGTCTATLASSANCTIIVSFAPTASGPFNQNLQVAFHDGATAGMTSQRAIAGTGTTPASLSISDAGYAFPMQILSGSIDKTFTVTNSGEHTAISLNGYGLTTPFTFKGGSFPGTGGTCGSNLSGSATCTVVVTFAPSSDGSFNDSLEIDYNNGVTTTTVSRAISGTADVTPPVATTFSSPISGTTNVDLIPINIVFSEPVAGNFTAASLYSAQGTIVHFSGSGNTYQALFAPTATNSNVQLVIPGYGSQDIAGNWQPGASSTLSWNFTMPQGASSLTGLPSAPPAARDPIAVWLGATWFVWGGSSGGTPVSGGSIFDPSSNSWTAITSTGAPTARDRAVAAFNGKQILVWGGNTVTPQGDGKLYDTALNSWSTATNTGAPTARHSASIVSHGNAFFIWGGNSGGSALNTGAIYNSSLNTWTTIPTAGAPTARYHHGAVAAGSQMLVWGGNDGAGSMLQNGGRLDMGTLAWSAMSTTSQPSAREDFSYVWTGSRLIVWGGSGPGATLLNDGAIYDPGTDTWSAISNGGNTPSARASAKAVWTGTHMIISGGITVNGPSGEHFALDPVTGNWTRLRSSIAEPRAHHAAVWTGSRMVEFGGETYSGVALNSGNVLDPMFSGARVKDVVMGPSHTCAISEAGSVKCWGSGTYGALGAGDTTSRGDGASEMGGNLPYVNLGTGKQALKIAVGGGFTCALLNDYSVKCWGRNDVGQLGLGHTNNLGDGGGEMGDSLLALNLGGQRAVDISAGSAYACAVTEYGQVKCWGLNSNGQLGDGTTTNSTSPITVSGISNGAVQIMAGAIHACVRTYDAVKCWGSNVSGQVGDSTNTARLSPVAVSGLGDLPIRTLTGGGNSVCAALPGLWKCWGDNASGALGDNSTTDRNSPGAVNSGGSNMLTLTQAGSHACAIDAGSIRCWGLNLYGQLGINSTSATMQPGAFLSSYSSGAIGLSSGSNANCAWYQDGSVRCWGQGSYGRLGMGNTTDYGTGSDPMSGLGAGFSLF